MSTDIRSPHRRRASKSPPLPFGFKRNPAALNLTSVQRSLAKWVRPAWWAVLVSGTTALLATGSQLVGLQTAWVRVANFWSLTIWLIATVAALLAAFMVPKPSLTIPVRS